MTDVIRLLIADDNNAVRDGLKSVLADEDKIKVVGEAADGNEAIFKAKALQPDVILLDIMMPRCNGLDALPAIREKAPGAKVIVMSVSAAERDLATARESGACGYLLKSSGINDFSEAIRRVMDGEIICSPQVAKYPTQRIQPLPIQQTVSAETKSRKSSLIKMNWWGARH